MGLVSIRRLLSLRDILKGFQLVSTKIFSLLYMKIGLNCVIFFAALFAGFFYYVQLPLFYFHFFFACLLKGMYVSVVILICTTSWAIQCLCANLIVVMHSYYLSILINILFLYLGAQYYSTGAIVPRTNNTVITVPLSLSGTFVIPAFEFQHSGKVTHWDFEVVKKGFISLLVRYNVKRDTMKCL